MIGPGSVFSGELSGQEDVLVDGRIEGKVRLEQQLTVGASGVVEADVEARKVLIAGRVIGDVSAAEKVEIIATDSLDGNIRAGKIVIAEGAHFKGTVDMASGRHEDRGASKDADPRGDGSSRTIGSGPAPEKAGDAAESGDSDPGRGAGRKARSRAERRREDRIRPESQGD